MIIFLFFFCFFCFEVEETTIEKINTAFLNKEIDCETLIRLHIDRINQYDEKVNSIITINPLALFQAKEFDKNPKFGKLWCIPTIVKDNIDIVNLPTSAGSLSLATSFPKSTAPSMQILLDEGVIILGKANMAEFAIDGMNTNTSIGGQVKNVYCPDRTPYGSSGGPAAAITSSFAVIGIGTDTCSSIVNPSSAASLVGLRPDRNNTNNIGIVPANYVQDVYGPMCRSAVDTSLVWNILRNVKPIPPPYIISSEKKRIGYISDVLESKEGDIPDQDIINLVNLYLSKLKKSEVVEIQPVKIYFKIKDLISSSKDIIAQSSIDLNVFYFNQYLKENKTQFVLPDLRTLAETEMYEPYLKSLLFYMLQKAKDPFTSKECEKYGELRKSIRDIILEELDINNLDLLIYPSSNQKPPLLSQLKDNVNKYTSMFGAGHISSTVKGFDQGTCALSAYSGLPSVGYPIGFTSDVSKSPFGMISLSKTEEIVLEWAKWNEVKFQFRKAPTHIT